MSIRRHIVIPTLCALLGLLALCALWWLYPMLSSHAAPVLAARLEELQVQTVNGATVLTVPAAMQRASGIVATPLAAATLQPEQTGYGTVLDPQPLFELGNRLSIARAERDAVHAQAEASAAQAARAQMLFRDDRNVSQKAMQDAQAAAHADQARLASANSTCATIAATIRQQFGAALAAAAETQSALWRQLTAGQSSLVRITFAGGAAAPPDKVSLAAATGRSVDARKLSAAGQVDPMLQGASYVYMVAPALPAGMRTLVHAASGPGKAGVLIPDSAIVWYGDTRWVYLRDAGQRYTRRLVEAAIPAAGGLLSAQGLRAGDLVVTQGAALLLSEEQRPRGIATQCKDPPECDD